ncbi:hypothetical protein [Pelagibacterium sp. H642]|uniref:hypothetical protein n=1 Tax=Pelagibacterium sp. H642 TaxID=1881069 RepID=UPI0028163CA9|nr:hypothetical protein [Pelagibacterium sp. H642]WMT89150.1 hypothetical protein NO934_09955 [Pelagibacterium sp. H642]
MCTPIPTGSAQSILSPPTGTEAPAIIPLGPHQNGAEPVSPNETHPNAKRLASEVALALTNYSANESAADIAERVSFASAGAAVQLAEAFHFPGAWSQGRILYPQLGGLGEEAASVMVVTEQMVGTPDGVRVFIRTLDVRLALVEGSWHFARLASEGGTQIMPTGPVPQIALTVLNDPRIEMPDSARWDILSGNISTNLLTVMARLAERTPYGVTTLSQGHPYEVFGTDRQSDHTRGRAVDIYRLGNTLVIDDRASGSFTHDIVKWLYDQPEIRQIGSPWALDGYGGRSFTDKLHQDHLHVAVAQ